MLGTEKCAFVLHLKNAYFSGTWWHMGILIDMILICSFHLSQEKLQSTYILRILLVLNRMTFKNSIEL